MKDLVNDGFRNVVKPYIDNEDKKSREIIAPVEVSPAEAAHSIGDQIVYNGILYDVTAAIAIGDALATSGAGENISEADDITTQLKNHTVTTDATPTQGSTNPVQSGGVYTSEQGIFAVMGANGAKNKVPFNLKDIINSNDEGTWNGNIYTISGVAYTVEGGKYIANNAATGNANIYPIKNVDNFYLPAGSYIGSGCPSGGANDKYYINFYNQTDGASLGTDYGDGITFALEAPKQIVVRVSTRNGYTASDLEFKPMIRDSRDTDPTFEPFAETNKELTAEITGLKDNAFINGCHNVFNLENIATGDTVTTITNKGANINIKQNTAASWARCVFKKIAVKPNTNYIFTSDIDYVSGRTRIAIRNTDDSANIFESTDITSDVTYKQKFNTGNNSAIVVRMFCTANTSETGETNFNNAMIRLASDTDESWSPYAKTNRELTEENNIETGSLTGDLTFNSNNITKKNGIVTIYAAFVADKDYAAFTEFANIPSGFRPINVYPMGILFNDSHGTCTSVTGFAVGKIQASMAITSGEYYRIAMTYIIA